MTSRRALVTGATGQDGTYLVAELQRHAYFIIAATRNVHADHDWGSSPPHHTVALDVTDQGAVSRAILDHEPDVIFNLAARSSGRGMFDEPAALGAVNGLGVTNLLEAIRLHRPHVRLCQASSSEVFGQPQESPQSEMSITRPRSPYGAAKLYADHMVQLYRKHFGMFACSAILFNHESPLRRPEFVSRKVTMGAAAIKLGRSDEISLGDLEARRDWGFAGDYMRAMRLMTEQDEPRDYVLATGEGHSVRDLCDIAFRHVDLDYRRHVRTNPADARAPEAMQLVGDTTQIRADLGWSPRTSFTELIHMMVDADLARMADTDLA